MTAEEIVKLILDDNTPIDKEWLNVLKNRFSTDTSRMKWAVELCNHYADGEDDITIEESALLLREKLFGEKRNSIRIIIRRQMRQMNVRSRDLAGKVGCSRTTLSLFLSGRAGISVDTLEKILNHLHLQVVPKDKIGES
jgi:DNA-binding Xre family transcriptional regulator